MVWLTRHNPWINGGTSRVLVNLASVAAITPDEDGCTLYWMDAQTSWRVTESIEEIAEMQDIPNPEVSTEEPT